MPAQMLGWVLIILGVLLLLVGFAGAVQVLMTRRRAMPAAEVAEDRTTLTMALRVLIRALLSAPLWLACVIVGIALLILGSHIGLAGVNLIPGVRLT